MSGTSQIESLVRTKMALGDKYERLARTHRSKRRKSCWLRRAEAYRRQARAIQGKLSP